jgi:hypothetical protein
MVNFLVYLRNSFRAIRKVVRWAVGIDIFLWLAKHLGDENETSCRFTRRATGATKAVVVGHDLTAVGRKSRYEISTISKI